MNWSSFGTFEGWLAIIGLAIGTFAIRYSFIGLLAGKKPVAASLSCWSWRRSSCR